MNYLAFQKSISNELIAIKDRVRNIIDNHHWGEEGRYKEVILMDILKKRLPNTVSVGTGFIINQHEISTQVDIIIYRNDMPIILQQGDFVIVPSECVLGIIEVKSSLNSTQVKDAIIKSAYINRLFRDRTIFNGIFAFDNQIHWDRNLIPPIVKDALINCNGSVNYICLGQNYFAKSWESYQPSQTHEMPHYSFYKIENLSFGYFISNLIEDVYCALTDYELPRSLIDMFYPIVDTKEAHIFDDFTYA